MKIDKNRKAQLEELAACLERARRLRAALYPSAEVACLRRAGAPIKGADVADALKRPHSSVVNALKFAIGVGLARRVGVGLYEAMPQ
jgi:23S rRNA pseudoU1915 N3-methylase RlmH